MKIAVIGGGTAGYMAAVHVTKQFPTCELIHIYDSRIPTIGVGESTTPPFLTWLHDTTPIAFAELQTRCDVTRKFGIQFENWGRKHPHYTHFFHPTNSYAYHLSAAKLVTVLDDYAKATHIDQKVTDVQSNGRSVTIEFEAVDSVTADFAFDARGFPTTFDDSHLKFSCIPTNAAFIRSAGPASLQTVTRAVARPCGWIFVIPLTTSTSYGYIYNDTLNTQRDIEADFNQFLQDEQVTVSGPDRWLSFPNYTHRTYFDGALFKLGNAAAFLEPLESTAIATIVVQLRFASFWLLDRLLGLSKNKGDADATIIKMINTRLYHFIQKIALFISWHYAKGASFDSPFWDLAQTSFADALKNPEYEVIIAEFEEYVRDGGQLPDPTLFEREIDFENPLKIPEPPSESTFGGFLLQSFTEVGYGIDFYN